MALFANKANKANNCKMGTLWIARDEDGNLWMFDKKPEKKSKEWWNGESSYRRLNPDQFLEVQWEDDEPTEVELKIVKK